MIVVFPRPYIPTWPLIVDLWRPVAEPVAGICARCDQLSDTQEVVWWDGPLCRKCQDETFEKTFSEWHKRWDKRLREWIK